MLNRNLNVLSLFLLLAGCGGGEFTSAAEPEADGTGGAVEEDAGSGGALLPGTGGVTGVTGGQAAVTGGSGGTGGDVGGAAGGGTGGQQAGSGGDPGATGGTATGGQQPATGGASGGTCKVPRLMPEDLPQQIIWESYSSRYAMNPADACLSCQHSPCATCSVDWWPVDQSADGLTLTALAAVKCGPVDVSLVVCGNDPSVSSCTTWASPEISSTLVFSLQPKSDGTGYTAVYRTNSSSNVSSYRGLGGSCSKDAFDGAVNANQPMWSLWYALRDAVIATEWPCG